jgi:hypothetical protein
MECPYGSKITSTKRIWTNGTIFVLAEHDLVVVVLNWIIDSMTLHCLVFTNSFFHTTETGLRYLKRQ